MNRHMKDWHNTIWTAAQHADELAQERMKDKSFLANAEGSILTANEVGEVSGQMYALI